MLVYFRIVVSTLLFLAACDNSSTPEVQKAKAPVSLVSYVNPFIGTGAGAYTFPGAAYPFGRIQLSPDTRFNGVGASNGYHFNDSIIYGFSHTHISGSKDQSLGDVLLLPYSGNVPENNISSFSHFTEIARPGYYSVVLSDFDIKCELSTTKRSGWHKYTYPQNKSAGTLIDLSRVPSSSVKHEVRSSWVKVVNNTTLEGYRIVKRGNQKGIRTWFKIVYNAPFTVEQSENVSHSQNSGYSSYKDGIKLWLSFGRLPKPLQTIVTLSSVDRDGVKNNMLEAQSMVSFDNVMLAASNDWEDELSEIQIKSKDWKVLTNFYSALYHTKLAPSLFSDSDDRYMEIDQKTYSGSTGNNYSNFALGSTFRAWFPLMTIIKPALVNNWTYSLYDAYKIGGTYPSSIINNANVEGAVAYPSLAVLADVLSKHIVDSLSSDMVLAAEKTAIGNPEWFKQNAVSKEMDKHINYKESIGFSPVDKTQNSVSWGLEMAYFDWCVARMKDELGDRDDAKEWYKRGQFYRYYFDAESNTMRGKCSDGSWGYEQNCSVEFPEYASGSESQWTNFVPHDVGGLRELYGGKLEMGVQLDKFFSKSTIKSGLIDTKGTIGLYNHAIKANQHVPYLYNYTNMQYRTSEIVDSILYTLYDNTPEGIVGDEACGQTSAWYVLSALGFYQVCPGRPVYDLGRPIVDEALIKVGTGWFTIKVHNNSRKNKYIQKVLLNNVEIKNCSFHHNAIKAGAKMEVFMDATY